MEKRLYSKKHIQWLRYEFGKIEGADPDKVLERARKHFETMNNDELCQVARAEIRWYSRAAYIYLDKHRGVKLGGWADTWKPS